MQKPPSTKGGSSTAPKRKKLALGKGLSALIKEAGTDGPDTAADYFNCPITQVRPNRHQPRMRFNDTELDELSQSIRTQGILQPLLVRRDGAGYELIAGERRLRAAKKAGLRHVPVVVKDVGESELLEMSIIENIQRQDLNVLEEADAYYHLMKHFGLNQDAIAERVGKSRSAVANLLRLRQLPEPIKAVILEERLSMGHARALLGANTPAIQNKAWRTVMSKALSVRETENLIKRLNRGDIRQKAPEMDSEAIYFAGLAEDLSRHYGTKVQIKRKGQRGKVEIEFYSNADLDRLLNLMKSI